VKNICAASSQNCAASFEQMGLYVREDAQKKIVKKEDVNQRRRGMQIQR